MIYTDEMATSTSAATTYTAMTGSPYSPLKSGRLKSVIVSACGDAATSLIEMVVVQLTNPMWGVPITITLSGAGIRTAPANSIPPKEQIVDMPVQIGSPITIQIKNETGATPITPRYSVTGVFEG